MNLTSYQLQHINNKLFYRHKNLSLLIKEKQYSTINTKFSIDENILYILISNYTNYTHSPEHFNFLKTDYLQIEFQYLFFNIYTNKNHLIIQNLQNIILYNLLFYNNIPHSFDTFILILNEIFLNFYIKSVSLTSVTKKCFICTKKSTLMKFNCCKNKYICSSCLSLITIRCPYCNSNFKSITHYNFLNLTSNNLIPS